MLSRLPEIASNAAARPIELSVNNQKVTCYPHDTVATALLAADQVACRTSVVTGQARGPFCMMGVCYECLVTIDGQPNQQGCMTRVRAGMVITFQHGARKVEPT